MEKIDIIIGLEIFIIFLLFAIMPILERKLNEIKDEIKNHIDRIHIDIRERIEQVNK